MVNRVPSWTCTAYPPLGHTQRCPACKQWPDSELPQARLQTRTRDRPYRRIAPGHPALACRTVTDRGSGWRVSHRGSKLHAMPTGLLPSPITGRNRAAHHCGAVMVTCAEATY